MTEPIVILKGIHKSFGSNKVLNGLDLTVNKNEVLTLVGPSRRRKDYVAEMYKSFGAA